MTSRDHCSFNNLQSDTVRIYSSITTDMVPPDTLVPQPLSSKLMNIMDTYFETCGNELDVGMLVEDCDDFYYSSNFESPNKKPCYEQPYDSSLHQFNMVLPEDPLDCNDAHESCLSSPSSPGWGSYDTASCDSSSSYWSSDIQNSTPPSSPGCGSSDMASCDSSSSRWSSDIQNPTPPSSPGCGSSDTASCDSSSSSWSSESKNIQVPPPPSPEEPSFLAVAFDSFDRTRRTYSLALACSKAIISSSTPGSLHLVAYPVLLSTKSSKTIKNPKSDFKYIRSKLDLQHPTRYYCPTFLDFGTDTAYLSCKYELVGGKFVPFRFALVEWSPETPNHSRILALSDIQPWTTNPTDSLAKFSVFYSMLLCCSSDNEFLDDQNVSDCAQILTDLSSEARSEAPKHRWKKEGRSKQLAYALTLKQSSISADLYYDFPRNGVVSLMKDARHFAKTLREPKIHPGV